MNEDRAARIEMVRKVYQGMTGEDYGLDREAFVTDLLADLQHWCAGEGLDFNTRLEMARVHYEEEASHA